MQTLTPEQIIEGNLLIAESKYSGLLNLQKARPEFIARTCYQLGIWLPEYENEKGIYKSPLDKNYAVIDHVPDYHIDYKWLMPVVDAIEAETDHLGLHNIVFIYGKQCSIEDEEGEDVVKCKQGDTKAEAVWLAVVEYIGWRNKCVS